MTRYRYIGETPSIIGPVSVDAATVTCPKGTAHEHADRGTVIAYPGDEISTDIVLTSALLEELADKPETAKERKAREAREAAEAEPKASVLEPGAEAPRDVYGDEAREITERNREADAEEGEVPEPAEPSTTDPDDPESSEPDGAPADGATDLKGA